MKHWKIDFMLSSLLIENFKAHKSTSLTLGHLTVLAGVNGSGKSSVFQALLLLRQSHEKNLLKKGIDLNKPHVNIGTVSDALYQYSDTDTIRFQLSFSDGTFCDWKFKPSTNSLNKTFIPIVSASEVAADLAERNLFGSSFHYLSAGRLAPSQSYPLDTYLVEELRQLSIERGQGELTAHYLYYFGQEKKEEISILDLVRDNTEPLDLLSQTSAWEREISPNVNVIPHQTGRSFELRYSFKKANDITASSEYLAENVGFGLSYALPIIVALLSAKPGSLILIENPEAHLHPYGQSKLAELICLAANAGVQVIIETHSDHIINGILVASKNHENEKQGIDRDLVRIYHFSIAPDTNSTQYEEVRILAGASLDQQPEQFFRQIEKDMSVIMDF